MELTSLLIIYRHIKKQNNKQFHLIYCSYFVDNYALLLFNNLYFIAFLVIFKKYSFSSQKIKLSGPTSVVITL